MSLSRSHAISRPGLSWTSEFENKHVSFSSPDGRQTLGGVLRFIGQAVNTTRKNVVGIVMDERRPTVSKTCDGFYQGSRIIECPPGYGYVCPVEDFERALLKVSCDGNDFWVCKECCHVNPTPIVSSLDEFLNMPVEVLDVLLRCAECNTVRVWLCPHPTCVGLPPLEVADIRGAVVDDGFADGSGETKVVISSVTETLTCPRCLRCPVEDWPCPQCGIRNNGFWCGSCEARGEPLVPQRDAVILLHWLRNPHLQQSPAWTAIKLPAELVSAPIAPPGTRYYYDTDGTPHLLDPESGLPEGGVLPPPDQEKTFREMLKDIQETGDQGKLREMRRMLSIVSQNQRRVATNSIMKGRSMPWEVSMREAGYEMKGPTEPRSPAVTCPRDRFKVDGGYMPAVAKTRTTPAFTVSSTPMLCDLPSSPKSSSSPRRRRQPKPVYTTLEDVPYGSRPMKELDALFSPVHGSSRFDVSKLSKPTDGKYTKMRSLIRGIGDIYDDGMEHTGQSMMMQSAMLREAARPRPKTSDA